MKDPVQNSRNDTSITEAPTSVKRFNMVDVVEQEITLPSWTIVGGHVESKIKFIIEKISTLKDKIRKDKFKYAANVLWKLKSFGH